MLLRTVALVFLIVVWGVLTGSICRSAPLMVEKNLFSTDRKPPSPESEASQGQNKPSMAVGNFQLDGVIIRNSVKKAILRLKNTQPSGGRPAGKTQSVSPFITVREGQTVNEYRVSKIELKSVSLEKDGQTFTIDLFAENKVATPPSPVPAPGAAPAPPPPAQPPAQPPASQPTEAQVQPADNPQQVQGQQAPGPGRSARGRNRNAQVAEPPPPPEQNQPVETVEEEQQ